MVLLGSTVGPGVETCVRGALIARRDFGETDWSAGSEACDTG